MVRLLLFLEPYVKDLLELIELFLVVDKTSEDLLGQVVGSFGRLDLVQELGLHLRELFDLRLVVQALLHTEQFRTFQE